MSKPGTYCLCIQVLQDIEITIGALGKKLIEKGLYIYIGSAMNGIEPRVKRHIKTNKNKTTTTPWHIDYLLKSPNVNLDSVFIKESVEKLECLISEEISKIGVPINGFGCSDCKCKSHLYKISNCLFIESYGFQKKLWS